MDSKVSQSKRYSFRVPGKRVTSCEWPLSDILLRPCEEWTLEMPGKLETAVHLAWLGIQNPELRLHGPGIPFCP